MPGDQRAPQASPLVIPASLATGNLEVLGALPNASNAALLVRASDASGSTLAVYKPAQGEAPLWDFPEGTLHRREVAAFTLARALGWPRVPPTVLRDGPYGPGSLQLFVPFDPQEHFFTLEETYADDFRRVAAFDIVANNADRKAGHCLLGDDGGLWLIDHGVCFAAQPKLRTVIWSFVGEAIPPELRTDLARVGDDLASDGSLGAELSELLSAGEVRALRRRLEDLLAEGMYPEPDPTMRSFPWPPI